MRHIRRYYFIPIISLSLSLLSAAEPGEQLIWQGIKSWYNYDTGRSVAILDSARKVYPQHPTVHLVYAAALYQHSQAHDPIEENYRVLEEALAEIIPVYNALVRSHPERPVYRLYQGSAIGLKARVHLGRKEWFRTLWAAYQGFSIIDDVAEEYPELIDAQLPIGIVEYYAELSGFIGRIAAGFFGLKPSFETGRAAIINAADNGEFAWIEAKSILVYLYIYIENRPELAIPHLEVLAENFPQNWYYQQLLTESLLKTDRLERGGTKLELIDAMYDSLTEFNKKNFGGYLNYEWGMYYYQQGNTAAALEALDRVTNNYEAELDAVLACSYLLKGKIFDMQGNRALAEEMYRAVIELDNFTYPLQQAEQYLKQPFVPVK